MPLPDDQQHFIPCAYYSICGSRPNAIYKIHYVKEIQVTTDPNISQAVFRSVTLINQDIDIELTTQSWVSLASYLDQYNSQLASGYATSQELRQALDNNVAFNLSSIPGHTFQNAEGLNGINYLTKEIAPPGGCEEPEMIDFFNPFVYAVVEGTEEQGAESTMCFAPNEPVINDGRTTYTFDIPIPMSGIGNLERGVYTLIANHVSPQIYGNQFASEVIEDIEETPRDTGLVFSNNNASPEVDFPIFSSGYGGVSVNSIDGFNVPFFLNKNPFANENFGDEIATSPCRYFKFQLNYKEVGSEAESMLQNFQSLPEDGAFRAEAVANNSSFSNPTASTDSILYGTRRALSDSSFLPPPPEDESTIQDVTEIVQDDATPPIIEEESSTTNTTRTASNSTQQYSKPGLIPKSDTAGFLGGDDESNKNKKYTSK
tara:strand:- start:1984 stop:3273 length:1290 start_codon:yes stop_codon:yes gene_type:complete